MKIIKKLNNNVVLCIDDSGKSLVAIGNGLGFHNVPYEIENKDQIVRTFYDVDPKFIDAFNSIPYGIIVLTSKIIDRLNTELYVEISPNIIFTLADHIQFVIKRYRDGINVKIPLAYDLRQLYPKELEISKYAIDLIDKQYQIELPEQEIVGIAMSIISSENYTNNFQQKESDEVISLCIKIIEFDYGMSVDKDSINYSRFATHMIYLLKRATEKKEINSDNLNLYEILSKKYQKAANASKEISALLSSKYSFDLNKEEQMYLMLHINRLISH